MLKNASSSLAFELRQGPSEELVVLLGGFALYRLECERVRHD